MIDMTLIESFIHAIFHTSDSVTLSKQDILAKVGSSGSHSVRMMLPYFKQLPNNEYDELGLKDDMQTIIQDQSPEAILKTIGEKIKL